MTALHNSSSDTRCIYRWRLRTHKEHPNKKASRHSSTDIIDLIFTRKYRFKDKTFALSKSLFAQHLTISDSLFNRFCRVPITKLLLCNNIGIDIYSILHPLVTQYLLGNSSLARPIGSSNNNQNRFVIICHRCKCTPSNCQTPTALIPRGI